MVAAVLLLAAGACAGPSIDEVPTSTAVVPTPTATSAPPTAAVGSTLGSACESGRLRFADLPAMDDEWEDGLAVARGRALDWQPDAVLVELRVACELFEPGFRWQATYFSGEAQANYSSDTAEVVPVELDPRQVAALPEPEIRFAAVGELLASNGYDDEDPAMRLESVRLVVSTEADPVGPPGVPDGHLVAHVRVQSHGQIVELYVDVTSGGIYRYGDG